MPFCGLPLKNSWMIKKTTNIQRRSNREKDKYNVIRSEASNVTQIQNTRAEIHKYSVCKWTQIHKYAQAEIEKYSEPRRWKSSIWGAAGLRISCQPVKL